MTFHITIPVSQLDEGTRLALGDAQAKVNMAFADGRKGVIIAQVKWEDEEIYINGDFIEHEYAKRIQDVLTERAEKLKPRNPFAMGKEEA